MSLPSPQTTVQEAFSRQAAVFDEIDRASPLITWVRDRVRGEVLRWLKPGMHLLEINAGSGIDSVFFAERGIRVLATDDAPGMIAQLMRKQGARVDLPLRVMPLSFHDLRRLERGSFDHVFSNFGGLNCTDRLAEVLSGVDHVLKPGGICSLVIMPRTSLWELAELFRFDPGMAFRRRRASGAPARIEGVTFQCHYYDPSFVRRSLKGYDLELLMGLSVVVPPPHLGPFAGRHPRLVRVLERLEQRIRCWPVFRSCGDHYLIMLRKPA